MKGKIFTVADRTLIRTMIVSVFVAAVLPLATPAQASLRVYDLAGRLVRTLASRDFAAGRHVVPWDRRSDRGIAASPGVYLCELRACGERRAGRLVLLK